jgi:DNA-binding NtrC family response regulator
MLAEQFARDLGRTLSARALLRIQAHAWPGNVRELRHCIERAAGLAGSFQQVLDEEAFAFLLNAPQPSASPNFELSFGAPILTLWEMEKHMLCRALRLCRGNRAKAAQTLGVARSTLFEMLKRHNIHGQRSLPDRSPDLREAEQMAHLSAR